MKLTKLVIDENRWLRAGRGGGLYEGSGATPKGKAIGSSLLDPEAKRMCCLGFASVAAGASHKDICRVGAPSGLKHNIKEQVRKKMPWLFSGTANSAAAADLMVINDNPKVSLPQKRKKIKKIFAKNGIEVIFIR